MPIRNLTIAVFTWLLASDMADALSIALPTDAEWIKRAERIVIGTLESQGDRAVIRVGKVLKGDAFPDVIETRLRPEGRHASKVLWAGPSGGEKFISSFGYGHFNAHLTYIDEGSPTWKLYHSLENPELLLEIDRFPERIEAAKVIGHLFDALEISSPDVPAAVSSIQLPVYLPWDYQGVIELRCRRHSKKTSRLELLDTDPPYENWAHGFVSRGSGWKNPCGAICRESFPSISTPARPRFRELLSMRAPRHFCGSGCDCRKVG
jgi:hypothetical protein